MLAGDVTLDTGRATGILIRGGSSLAGARDHPVVASPPTTPRRVTALGQPTKCGLQGMADSGKEAPARPADTRRPALLGRLVNLP